MSNPAKETRPRLTGVIAAMLTPMRDAGTRVDAEAATRLVSWLVDRGIHGLYIAGTTGEGLYLSPDEHRELARAVVKAARGVPVVVHVGALTTAQAVALARQAVQVEATAVAAIPPPYYSLTHEELLAYFTAIAKAAEPLPLYLYNIPSHARNELPPAFVAECGRTIPSVRGIKDSSGVAGRIPELVKALGPGLRRGLRERRQGPARVPESAPRGSWRRARASSPSCTWRCTRAGKPVGRRMPRLRKRGSSPCSRLWGAGRAWGGTSTSWRCGGFPWAGCGRRFRTPARPNRRRFGRA